MEKLPELTNFSGSLLEICGEMAIVLGALYSLVMALYYLVKRVSSREVFTVFRRNLGSSILLGLEFLVAGDIIRTVAVEPTFTSVGILAAIVLIRTFLSFTLEVEMTGRWPWQK